MSDNTMTANHRRVFAEHAPLFPVEIEDEWKRGWELVTCTRLEDGDVLGSRYCYYFKRRDQKDCDCWRRARWVDVGKNAVGGATFLGLVWMAIKAYHM